MKSILCIEDSREVQHLVESCAHQHHVTAALTLADAQESLKSNKYDLIILDIELPDGNGLNLFSRLHAFPLNRETSVFILSGRHDSTNQVMAFSLGAEDYIAKPFDPVVLQARIEAKLRKIDVKADRQSIIRMKDIVIDTLKQRVMIKGTPDVSLTSLEFKLLALLSRNPERVFSRNQLLDEVWGDDISITDRTVDAHISHLRKKIALSQLKIETVINEGYRLV